MHTEKSHTAELVDFVLSLPPGPMRDDYIDRLQCYRHRLEMLPERVAAQSAFKSAYEAKEVFERELLYALSALDDGSEARA
jgi:hypothetical protein